MLDSTERALRQSYGEILNGFSITKYKDSRVFIRHLSNSNSLETDFIYSDSYTKTVEKGYPTEKQRLEQLEKDGLWLNSDENRMEELKLSLKDYHAGKKKAFLKKDIDFTNQKIKEEETLLEELFLKRESLVGATAEKFTRKNVDIQIIYQGFFKDIELKTLVYSENDFEELEQSELNELFSIYNQAMVSFSDLNIKKIALLPFFQNAFSLTDSIYEFYGKPICQLTNFQVHLGIYGNYYKNILSSEARPPDKLLEDPEKLEDWFTSKSNADKMLDKNVKNEDGEVSVFGATNEDFENWGYENQESPLRKATREAGGELSKEQIMALQGIK